MKGISRKTVGKIGKTLPSSHFEQELHRDAMHARGVGARAGVLRKPRLPKR